MPVDPIRRVPLGELKLWDKNPRSITKERFDSLKRSMEADPEMMEARPLISLRDGRVIAGNMRMRAALELNWDDIPTVVVDLTEEQAITWALRDNNPYGEYDDQGLAELLYELQQAEVDLDLTGFSVDDIERIFEGAPPPVDDGGEGDRGTELSIADVTVGDPQREVAKGEVWALGHHLLVCENVYDGWPKWVEFLTGDETLLVPYPTPTLPLTERAKVAPLVMIQPDPWLAGHVLDKYAAIHGDDSVSKLR